MLGTAVDWGPAARPGGLRALVPGALLLAHPRERDEDGRRYAERGAGASDFREAEATTRGSAGRPRRGGPRGTRSSGTGNCAGLADRPQLDTGRAERLSAALRHDCRHPLPRPRQGLGTIEQTVARPAASCAGWTSPYRRAAPHLPSRHGSTTRSSACRALPECGRFSHLGLHRLVDLAWGRARSARCVLRVGAKPAWRAIAGELLRQSGRRLAGLCRRAAHAARDAVTAMAGTAGGPCPRRGGGRRHDARGGPGGRGCGVRCARRVGAPARGLGGAGRGRDRRRRVGCSRGHRSGRRVDERQARAAVRVRVDRGGGRPADGGRGGRLRRRARTAAATGGRCGASGAFLAASAWSSLEPGPLEVLGLETARPALVAGAAEAIAGLEARRLRVLGSVAAAMCLVAAGRLDAMVTLRDVRSVDVAAAQLIVAEAGGAVALPGRGRTARPRHMRRGRRPRGMRRCSSACARPCLTRLPLPPSRGLTPRPCGHECPPWHG